MKEIQYVRTTTAPPEDVWRILADSRTWPNWTPIEEHTQVKPGGADGRGEVRRFKTGRIEVSEEIVEVRPSERLSYILLGGLAVKDYRADIDLTGLELGGGTRISWHTTFRPKIPGTGWIYKRALERATGDFIDGLAAYSAERAQEDGVGKPGPGGSTSDNCLERET